MFSLKLLGFLSIFFVIVSCHDEGIDPTGQCKNYAVELGPFLMEESTKNLFPYSNSIQRIVFLDELNQEFPFELDTVTSKVESYLYTGMCPFDTAIQVPYQRLTERTTAIFYNNDLTMTIRFAFAAKLSIAGTMVFGEADVADISINTYDFSSFTFFSSLIHTKYGNQVVYPVQFDTSIEINTITFYNTYTNLPDLFNSPPDWIISFNYEHGIVGVKHQSGSPVLAFDRFE